MNSVVNKIQIIEKRYSDKLTQKIKRNEMKHKKQNKKVRKFKEDYKRYNHQVQKSKKNNKITKEEQNELN